MNRALIPVYSEAFATNGASFALDASAALPATSATQKVGCAAMCRSYNGSLARRCRMINRSAAMPVITAIPANFHGGAAAGEDRAVEGVGRGCDQINSDKTADRPGAEVVKR
jgi:hypothetical protein